MTTASVALEQLGPAPADVVAGILGRVRRSWAPPPELKVSEFSDESIVLTSGPLAGTKWRTDFAPYQRGILDAFHENGVTTAVVMGSSQWGKTSIAVNLVAYHIRHDPAPTLVVEPTVEPMAKDFAKNRLDPVIRSSPDLAELFPKKRSKDASNTTLEKTYRGGFVVMAGANSAASLAARPIRVLVLDEIDRYPAELPGEGNTIAIALKRTTTYRRRKRILLLSSPTLVDAPIHAWFQRGDRRRYHVPCPRCGVMHPYEWVNVHWEHDDPATARLHCPNCDYRIGDAERVALLRDGEWIPDKPDRLERDIVSFHLWEAYSPLSSLPEIVTGFLRARKAQREGDRSEMHTWQNTTLGEPIEHDDGEGAEPHVLLARRKAYPDQVDVPDGAVILTMGVDTQDNRLEALVIGWGPGEESWLVDRLRFEGDTQQPEPWQQLTEQLAREYRHESGVRMPIWATCLDTAGHRTHEAYTWIDRNRGRRAFAVIGRSGQLPIVSSPSERHWANHRREISLYTVGADAAKSLIVPRLNLEEPGPGHVHIPMRDWVDDELALQLTAEKLVKRFKKGIPVQEWKQTRARNEALDCFVYALAALRLSNPDYALHEERLKHPRPPTPPSAPSTRPKWIPSRPGGGWLKKGNR